MLRSRKMLVPFIVFHILSFLFCLVRRSGKMLSVKINPGENRTTHVLCQVKLVPVVPSRQTRRK